jgi:hypothetical protein
MSDHPPYYHEINKPDAEALVGNENGAFLLRKRVSKGGEEGYLLTVVYKTNPTHHNLLLVNDGKWELNKKGYGSHSSADSLCKALAKPMKGWPVPLTNPIMNVKAVAEAALEVEAGAGADADVEVEVGAEPEALEPVKPNLTKTETDEPVVPELHMLALLKPVQGGMRGSKPQESKPKGPINFKQVEKIAKGKKRFQGLPGESPELMLPPSLLSAAGINVPAPKERKWRRASLELNEDEQRALQISLGSQYHGPAEVNYVSVSKIKMDSTESLPYFHPGCTKGEAERLVTFSMSGEHPDGTFLVRKQPPKDGEKPKFAFFLTVLYNGKPTHHPITKDTQNVVLINKKKFNGHKNVAGLLNELGKGGKSGWPVALQSPLLRPAAQADVAEEDLFSPKIGSPEKLAFTTFKLHELSEAQQAEEKLKEELYNREVQDARVMTVLETAEAARLKDEEDRFATAKLKRDAQEARTHEVMTAVIAAEEARMAEASASAVTAIHNNVAEKTQWADQAETHEGTILGKIAALKAKKAADSYIAPKVQKLSKVQLMAKAKREAELAVERSEHDTLARSKIDAKKAQRQAEIDAAEKSDDDARVAAELEKRLVKMPNWKREQYFANIKKGEDDAAALTAAVEMTKAQLAATEREGAMDRMQRLAREERERKVAEKLAIFERDRSSDLTRAGGTRNELAERFAKRGASFN